MSVKILNRTSATELMAGLSVIARIEKRRRMNALVLSYVQTLEARYGAVGATERVRDRIIALCATEPLSPLGRLRYHVACQAFSVLRGAWRNEPGTSAYETSLY